MPLIKAARGEPIDINQLKHAIIDGLDVAIGRLGSEPSYAFKAARDMINEPNNKAAEI